MGAICKMTLYKIGKHGTIEVIPCWKWLLND